MFEIAALASLTPDTYVSEYLAADEAERTYSLHKLRAYEIYILDVVELSVQLFLVDRLMLVGLILREVSLEKTSHQEVTINVLFLSGVFHRVNLGKLEKHELFGVFRAIGLSHNVDSSVA